MPKYLCNFCRRHLGPDGFKRLDHLKQHMVNYHHHDIDGNPHIHMPSFSESHYIFPVCPHPDCPRHRNAGFHNLPPVHRTKTSHSHHFQHTPVTCAKNTTKVRSHVISSAAAVLAGEGTSERRTCLNTAASTTQTLNHTKSHEMKHIRQVQGRRLRCHTLCLNDAGPHLRS
jgi:hypothetical protein